MKKLFEKKNLRNTIGVGTLVIGIILLILGSVIDNVPILSILGMIFSTGGLITALYDTKKHNLFKLAGGMVLLTVLFSWLIPVSSFSNGEMVLSEVTRIGLSDLTIYSLLSVYYFAIVVTFLLILGGMYEVLAKTSGYQTLIAKLTKFLKGKEIEFVLLASFLFALIAAFSNEIYQLLIFAPLIITLVLRLKMDKITALCTTFGSILIGVVGSLFSPMMFDLTNTYFSTTYESNAIIKIVLFVVTFVLFNFFNVMHLRKTLKDKKVDETKEDMFEVEETNKGKVWPIVVVFAVLAVFQILAYVSWTEVFEVKAFSSFHTWLTSLSVNEVPVISYLLGNASEFGKWDLYLIQGIMVLATLVIAWIYKVKFDGILSAFGEGAKKMLKPIIIILMIYVVCIFTVMYPVVPTIVSWIMGLAPKFNGILASISMIIGSIFNVEMRYVSSSLAPYFAAAFGSATNTPVMAIIFQTFYGFVQFFAPTSLMLMIGLSYLDIPYKTWMKYIWQFLVGLLIIIIALICFVAFI